MNLLQERKTFLKPMRLQGSNFESNSFILSLTAIRLHVGSRIAGIIGMSGDGTEQRSSANLSERSRPVLPLYFLKINFHSITPY